MNSTASIALVCAALATMMAVLSWGMAAAPGWRGLRWLSWSAAAAALYSLSDVPLTQPVPDAIIALCNRVAMVACAGFAASWTVLGGFLEGRPLARTERALIAGAVLFGLVAPIPGVLYGGPVEVTISSLQGAVYREAQVTLLGAACFTYCILLVLRVGVRHLWRRVKRGEGFTVHALASLALAAFGTNDALVALRLHAGVYLLDLGFFGVVCSVGTMLSHRVVGEARALQRLSAELAETQATLVRKERLAAIGEVAAVVAHEVRNPLAVLYNVVSQLRREHAPGSDGRQMVEMAAEEAERLERIVSELLDFTSPHPPTFAPCGLGEVVLGAATAALQAARLEARHLDVLLPDEPLVMQCDQGLLYRAVINLVTNALQAKGRSGPVRVRLSVPHGGEQAVIEVQDDGGGLPPELQQKIFEPFFTTRATGTGLGLTLVRRAAEAHGGEVEVDSTPGVGATFRLRLPLQRTLQLPRAALASAAGALHPGR